MWERKTEIQERIEYSVTNGIGFWDNHMRENFMDNRHRCDRYSKNPDEAMRIETALMQTKLLIYDAEVAKSGGDEKAERIASELLIAHNTSLYLWAFEKHKDSFY